MKNKKLMGKGKNPKKSFNFKGSFPKPSKKCKICGEPYEEQVSIKAKSKTPNGNEQLVGFYMHYDNRCHFVPLDAKFKFVVFYNSEFGKFHYCAVSPRKIKNSKEYQIKGQTLQEVFDDLLRGKK